MHLLLVRRYRPRLLVSVGELRPRAVSSCPSCAYPTVPHLRACLLSFCQQQAVQLKASLLPCLYLAVCWHCIPGCIGLCAGSRLQAGDFRYNEACAIQGLAACLMPCASFGHALAMLFSPSARHSGLLYQFLSGPGGAPTSLLKIRPACGERGIVLDQTAG